MTQALDLIQRLTDALGEECQIEEPSYDHPQELLDLYAEALAFLAEAKSD